MTHAEMRVKDLVAILLKLPPEGIVVFYDQEIAVYDASGDRLLTQINEEGESPELTGP